jgi:hypothetical protein
MFKIPIYLRQKFGFNAVGIQLEYSGVFLLDEELAVAAFDF